MLHRALKQTSEQLTNNLTKEIRELGNHTAALEYRVDVIENSAQEYMTEMTPQRGEFNTADEIGRL